MGEFTKPLLLREDENENGNGADMGNGAASEEG